MVKCCCYYKVRRSIGFLAHRSSPPHQPYTLHPSSFRFSNKVAWTNQVLQELSSPHPRSVLYPSWSNLCVNIWMEEGTHCPLCLSSENFCSDLSKRTEGPMDRIGGRACRDNTQAIASLMSLFGKNMFTVSGRHQNSQPYTLH